MRSALLTFSDDVSQESLAEALRAAGIALLDVESTDADLDPADDQDSPFRVVQDGPSYVVVEVDFTGREVWRASMAWPDAHAAYQHRRAATAAWARRRESAQGEAQVVPIRR